MLVFGRITKYNMMVNYFSILSEENLYVVSKFVFSEHTLQDYGN